MPLWILANASGVVIFAGLAAMFLFFLALFVGEFDAGDLRASFDAKLEREAEPEAPAGPHERSVKELSGLNQDPQNGMI